MGLCMYTLKAESASLMLQESHSACSAFTQLQRKRGCAAPCFMKIARGDERKPPPGHLVCGICLHAAALCWG